MTDEQKAKLKKVKDGAVFAAKQLGPTAVIMTLRYLKKSRAAEAATVAFIGYQAYREWKRRQKPEKKDGP